MSCQDTTTNNKPLGLGFNSRGNPVNLTELSSISVESLSASVVSATTYHNLNLELSSLSDVNLTSPTTGQVLVWDADLEQWINTTNPAGVTSLSSLDDVVIATPAIGDSLVWNAVAWVPSAISSASGATSNSFETIVVTTGSNVVADSSTDTLTFVSTDGTVVVSGNSTSDTIDLTVNEANLAAIPQSAVTNLSTDLSNKQPLNSTLTSLAAASTGADQFAYFSATNAIAIGALTSYARTILDDATASDARVTLELGSVATLDQVDHGSLSGLGDNDHPQYVLSATNSTLSSTVSTHTADSTIHFTKSSIPFSGLSDIQLASVATLDSIYWNGSKWANTNSMFSHILDSTIHFTQASIDHGSIAGLADNDHPQYVLSSTNSTLSSTVSSHTADSTIHFLKTDISLYDLINVSVDGAGLANGDIFTWSAAASKWVNSPSSAGGGGNAYGIIIPTTGGTLEATASPDTLNLISNDGTISISGNTSLDKLDFSVNEASLTVPQANVANLTTDLYWSVRSPSSISWFSDFIEPGASQAGFGTSNNGTGATQGTHYLAMITSGNMGIGVIENRVGTGTTNRASFTTYNDTLIAGQADISFSTRFTVSGGWNAGVNDGNHTVGICDNTNSNSVPNNGGYFYASSNNMWYTRTSAGGTHTVSSTGIGVSSQSFQVLQVVWPRTNDSIKFYIDGVLVSTHTTNMPTSRCGIVWKICKTAGTQDNHQWIDWFDLKVSNTRTSRGMEYLV